MMFINPLKTNIINYYPKILLMLIHQLSLIPKYQVIQVLIQIIKVVIHIFDCIFTQSIMMKDFYRIYMHTLVHMIEVMDIFTDDITGKCYKLLKKELLFKKRHVVIDDTHRFYFSFVL